MAGKAYIVTVEEGSTLRTGEDAVRPALFYGFSRVLLSRKKLVSVL